MVENVVKENLIRFLQVEWYYNGTKLPHGHRYRTFHDFGIVILDILYCYEENSGVYECRATNKYGADVTKASLKCVSKANLILDSQLPRVSSGIRSRVLMARVLEISQKLGLPLPVEGELVEHENVSTQKTSRASGRQKNVAAPGMFLEKQRDVPQKIISNISIEASVYEEIPKTLTHETGETTPKVEHVPDMAINSSQVPLSSAQCTHENFFNPLEICTASLVTTTSNAMRAISPHSHTFSENSSKETPNTPTISDIGEITPLSESLSQKSMKGAETTPKFDSLDESNTNFNSISHNPLKETPSFQTSSQNYEIFPPSDHFPQNSLEETPITQTISQNYEICPRSDHLPQNSLEETQITDSISAEDSITIQDPINASQSRQPSFLPLAISAGILTIAAYKMINK